MKKCEGTENEIKEYMKSVAKKDVVKGVKMLDDCVVVYKLDDDERLKSFCVEMAKIVLFPIYGKKEIEKHKPYQVKLINNEIWSIKGQLDNNHEGGTFSILINKSDGKVLAISHSK